MFTCMLSVVQHEATQTLARSTAAWQPGKGELLAVPSSTAGDIMLYDRHSMKAAATLAGGHTKTVNTLAFSTDGAALV